RLATRSASADIALYDEAGDIVGELSDCWFRRVELTRRGTPEDNALRIDLVPAPLGESESPAVLHQIEEIVGRLVDLAPDLGGRTDENALLLDALIASVGFEAVRSVVDPDVSFTIEDVVADGAIASDSADLFG